MLNRGAASYMAVALHSLQDSFSPGHTQRDKFTDPNAPGGILEIHIYSKQDHSKHSSDDFESGSIDSVHAKAAINASSELMYIAAHAVGNKANFLNDWKLF